ncbi:MAG: hypothetical protein ABI481_13410 [Pyrinomonadaceae bacterium]
MTNGLAETGIIPMRSLEPGLHESAYLIKRIEQRDRQAFSECVSRYGPFVWKLAKLFTSSTAEAEAATEEIFSDILHYQAPAAARRGDREIIVEIARKRILQHIKTNRILNG